MPEDRTRFDLGDYVEVKDRIKTFYELYGQGRLVAEPAEVLTAPDGKQRVVVRALAYRSPDDPHPAVGQSWMELPGTTPYTRGSELENTETSAIGRAIGFLGILIDRSIATGNEVRAKAGEDTGDAPVAVTPPPIDRDGLIGTAAKQNVATTDFSIRYDPAGVAHLGFRLQEGSRSGVICEVTGQMAEDIIDLEADTIGQRVQVWGAFVGRTVKSGATYRAFAVTKIKAPTYELPAEDRSAPSEAMFAEGELEAVMAKIP